MSECEKCHGEGSIPCSTCKGKKIEPCKKCNGSGKVLCTRCSGNGEITCGRCGGSGKKEDWKTCPVCNHGKITKTRWINCAKCHGTGRRLWRGDLKPCWDCDGRGQVKEVYTELCPNCHGDYRKSTEKTCAHCHGRGYFTCDTKCGENRKKIECDECDGVGHVTCSHCKGEGREKCPDCEKREKERKERETAQKKRQEEQKKREEEQKRMTEEKRRREEAEKERLRQEALQKAKERKDSILGCGCLSVLMATVGFFIWWWIEGMTMAALTDMWEQTKKCIGGSDVIAAIGGGLITLLTCWKLITTFKHNRKKTEVSTSSKKRWKFVVLGLLFGFLGAHLLYAKRWFLFLLLWAGLITGGSMSGDTKKPVSETPEMSVVQTEQNDKKTKEQGSPISGIGFGVWALLWIGGTLFIKKDGKGNRM